MAGQSYYVEIGNEYLGKYRRITGRTRREVEFKASEQLLRWSQEEERARERAAITDEKERAKQDTEEALALIEAYRGILRATLTVDDRVRWEDLREKVPSPEPPPTLEDLMVQVGVPARRPVMERLRPSLTARREEAEQTARDEHERLLREYDEAVAHREEEQSSRDAEVEEFRRGYQAGEVEAVERYVSLVLANSAYPEGFPREFGVQYLPEERTVVVDVELPSPGTVPRVIGHKYVAMRRTTDEVQMKDREFQKYYDDVVYQTIIRTLHELFEGDYAGTYQKAVVNAWVEGVNPATGRDFRSCIASCRADRERFLEMDLGRVEPDACFRELRGSSAARFASLKPVAPILRIERDDPRFIEAREVLDGLEAGSNLITMEWQDFEMLVRDLFEKVFADEEGVEVNVTRASRDEGVDAVIIDPHPLKGGKRIVQAKRYRKTVPAAAVRELYGAMQSERAGRGILVTTSHYGSQAQEFARDKEITLIDGAQFLHLMQNHGHKVRIDPSET